MNHLKNILIDSNLVVRQTDPELSFPTYLQGIVAFDSDWTNMQVTNNVVITSSCYSVQAASIHDSLIANNTGLNDGLISTPGCSPQIAVGSTSHGGSPSTNYLVYGNIADYYSVGGTNDSGGVYKNNIAISGGQGFIHFSGPNGTSGLPVIFGSAVGTDANGNVTVGKAKVLPLSSQFVQFDPANGDYIVLLKPASPARGVGIAPTGNLPTTDILGMKRTTPYAAGAYGYPY